MGLEDGLSVNDIKKNSFIYSQVVEDDYNGWFDESSQYLAFETSLSIVQYSGKSLKGESLLDVGCADGAMYGYLTQNFGDSIKYRGVDIDPRTLDIARKRYSGIQVEQRDLLLDPIEADFSYSIACGSLYGRLDDIDNNDFLKEILARMWQSTRYGMSFNFLPYIPRVQIHSSFLYLYKRDRVEKMCNELSGSKRVFMHDRVDRYDADTVDYFTDVFVVRD